MANTAVQGCVLQIEPSSGTGVATVTGTPATDVLIDNKGVFFGQSLTFSISGFTAATIPNWIPGSGSSQTDGTITPTGNNVLNSNQPAVLEGDTGQVTVVGKVQVGQSQVDTPCLVTVKVVQAGQVYVDVT